MSGFPFYCRATNRNLEIIAKQPTKKYFIHHLNRIFFAISPLENRNEVGINFHVTTYPLTYTHSKQM